MLNIKTAESIGPKICLTSHDTAKSFPHHFLIVKFFEKSTKKFIKSANFLLFHIQQKEDARK